MLKRIEIERNYGASVGNRPFRINYCEGSSELINSDEVVELGRRFKSDIVLAGMQLNFEEQVSQGIAALSPKSIILFHPHELLFEKIGLKSSSPQAFVEKIKQRLPETKVIIARPQSIYDIPLPNNQ